MCRLRQNSMLARGFHLRPDGAHSLSFFISVFVDDFNPTHDVLIELCQLFRRDPILLVLGTTNNLNFMALKIDSLHAETSYVPNLMLIAFRIPVPRDLRSEERRVGKDGVA